MPMEDIVFEAPDLGELELGKVFISAPSLKGVLQINTIDHDERVPLDITVNDGEVSIKRVDEQAVQVALVGNFYDNHENLHHPVFYRPQPEVKFRRVDDIHWTVENPQDVIDGNFRISVFADVISLYALQHQKRRRRQLTQRFYEGLIARTAALESSQQ